MISVDVELSQSSRPQVFQGQIIFKIVKNLNIVEGYLPSLYPCTTCMYYKTNLYYTCIMTAFPLYILPFRSETNNRCQRELNLVFIQYSVLGLNIAIVIHITIIIGTKVVIALEANLKGNTIARQSSTTPPPPQGLTCGEIFHGLKAKMLVFGISRTDKKISIFVLKK